MKHKLQAAVLALTIAMIGCASVPLDQKYTQKQLTAQLRIKAVCRASVTNPSAYTPDYDKCAEEEIERQEKLRTALAVRHAREIAAAPECLRHKAAGRTTLKEFGVDPDSPSPAAELVSRGVFIGGSLSQQCMIEICAWQNGAEPDRDAKLWCQS